MDNNLKNGTAFGGFGPSNRREVMSLIGVASLFASVPFSGGARAAQPGERKGDVGILYPHESRTRTTRELGGVWRFRHDPEKVGENQGWEQGLKDYRLIPVPASWNEIFDDLRNYTGTAWYETDLRIGKRFEGERIVLRFGSVQYQAQVWLNGKHVGGHTGGHLPFAIDVTDHVSLESDNRITVQVENEIRQDRVPSAPDTARYSMNLTHYPQTTYDFFPYAGIHRPVLVCTMPQVAISDVTVATTISGKSARVSIDIETTTTWSGKASVTLTGRGEAGGNATIAIVNGRGQGSINLSDAKLWSPQDPHLYAVTIRLEDPALLDEYRMKIGVRTIAVRGTNLLLNGKPVFLRGFGKHEDFVLNGRGLNVPAIVRDFELLKWIGANSFRTSHYPYSEEAMMLADEYGFLVIDETSAVSLVFFDPPATVEARRQRLEQEVRELIQRDKNHACVIMWSLANEPLTKPFQTNEMETPGAVEAGRKFFESVFALARSLDKSRPFAIVSMDGGPDEWNELGDVICSNKYVGWYYQVGQLDVARKSLRESIEGMHQRHPGKPVFISEFGADAVAGMHAQPAEMWSEEYQAEMIAMYVDVLEEMPFIIGTHPWAFADFRTSQSTTRVGALNHKGVFTRDRKPKLAAAMLKDRWSTPRR